MLLKIYSPNHFSGIVFFLSLFNSPKLSNVYLLSNKLSPRKIVFIPNLNFWHVISFPECIEIKSDILYIIFLLFELRLLNFGFFSSLKAKKNFVSVLFDIIIFFMLFSYCLILLKIFSNCLKSAKLAKAWIFRLIKDKINKISSKLKQIHCKWNNSSLFSWK